MKNLHVKSATIVAPGDRGVGIFEQQWQIDNLDFDPDVYATEDDARGALEDFRAKLKEAFEELIGDPVYVMFDTEYDEINETVVRMYEEDEERDAHHPDPSPPCVETDRAINEGPGPHKLTGNPEQDGTFWNCH